MGAAGENSFLSAPLTLQSLLQYCVPALPVMGWRGLGPHSFAVILKAQKSTKGAL